MSALADRYFDDQVRRLGPISNDNGAPCIAMVEPAAIRWPNEYPDARKAVLVFTFEHGGWTYHAAVSGADPLRPRAGSVPIHHVDFYRFEAMPLHVDPGYGVERTATEQFRDSFRNWASDAAVRSTVRTWRGNKFSGWMRQDALAKFVRDWKLTLDHVEGA